ncbi:MAG: hypothetical protein ACRD00_05630 [Thermoanaerobaculia bacterium]
MKPGHIWLLAFALLPAAGAPLALHRAYSSYGPFCRAALAAGIGAVVLSLVMTLAALVPVPWGIGWLVAVSVLVSWMLRFALGPEAQGPSPVAARQRQPLLLAAFLSTACVCVALFATSAGAASSSDLFRFWGPKAEAFASARTIDAEFLRAPWLAHLHADYPPLVTNLFAFATLAAGRIAWGAATYTFPLFLAALALALHGILSADRPRGEAYTTAALAVAATGLLGVGYEVSGNGDMMLLFFEACAMALLTGPEAQRGSRLLLSGLFLAGAASAKVEGLPFALAAAALFGLLSPRARTLRCAAFLLAPTAVCLGSWLAFGWTRQLFRFYQGYGRLAEVHLANLPLILSEVAAELTGVAWGLAFLVPLAVLLLCRPGSRRVWLPVGTASILSVFFLFTYLHDPGLMIHDWIHWSAGRIFTPVAVLVALAPLSRAGPGEG